MADSPIAKKQRLTADLDENYDEQTENKSIDDLETLPLPDDENEFSNLTMPLEVAQREDTPVLDLDEDVQMPEQYESESTLSDCYRMCSAMKYGEQLPTSTLTRASEEECEVKDTDENPVWTNVIGGFDRIIIQCIKMILVAKLFEDQWEGIYRIYSIAYLTLRPLSSRDYLNGFIIVASQLPSAARRNSIVYIQKLCVSAEALEELSAQYPGNIAKVILQAICSVYHDSITILASKTFVYAFGNQAGQNRQGSEMMAELFQLEKTTQRGKAILRLRLG